MATRKQVEVIKAGSSANLQVKTNEFLDNHQHLTNFDLHYSTSANQDGTTYSVLIVYEYNIDNQGV